MTSNLFPINDHVMFSDDGITCLEEFLVLDRLVVSCLESIPFPTCFFVVIILVFLFSSMMLLFITNAQSSFN